MRVSKYISLLGFGTLLAIGFFLPSDVHALACNKGKGSQVTSGECEGCGGTVRSVASRRQCGGGSYDGYPVYIRAGGPTGPSEKTGVTGNPLPTGPSVPEQSEIRVH